MSDEETLAQELVSGLPDTLEDLCELSLRFGTGDVEQEVQELLDAGLLPRLLGLLSSTSVRQQALTLTVMWNVSAESDEAREGMIDSDATLPRLVALLQSSSESVVESCLGCLWNIGTVDRARTTLCDLGVMPILYSLLPSLSDTLRYYATAVVSILSRDDSIGSMVANAEGVLDTVTKGLSHANPTIQEVSAACLWNIGASGDVTREAIVNVGAVPKLIRLLGASMEITEAATGALWNIAANTLGTSVLLDQYVDDIFDLLPGKGNTLDSPQSNALRCLANMTRFAAPEKLICLQRRGLAELAASWTSQKPVAFEAACIVANLLGHVENHPLLAAHSELVSDLATELRLALDGKPTAYNENAFAKPWALGQGIANLSVSETNKATLLAAGVLPLLGRLLREHMDDARSTEYGAKAMANLSMVTDVEESIEDLVGMLETLAMRPRKDPAREHAQLALFHIRQRRGKRQAQEKGSLSPQSHVYLSYAARHHNGQAVQWLKQLLFENGIRLSGSKLEHVEGIFDVEAAEKALEACQVMIAVVDRDFKHSQQCRFEGECAQGFRRPVVGVSFNCDGYSPDGWVKGILGQQDLFDLQAQSQENGNVLLQRLTRILAISTTHRLASELDQEQPQGTIVTSLDTPQTNEGARDVLWEFQQTQAQLAKAQEQLDRTQTQLTQLLEERAEPRQDQRRLLRMCTIL